MSMPSTLPSHRGRGLRLSALAVVVAAGALLAGNAGPAAAVPPEVISRWDNEIVHSGSLSPGFSGFLGAGSYTITAKLYAENTGFSAIGYLCTVGTGPNSDGDITEVTLAPQSRHSIFLNVVHHYPVTGPLTFACSKPVGTPQVVMRQVKITAVKVNTLDNQSFG
ncbi:hypothetical protein [Nonomuraea jiangxiensis]|uniref:Secreted protein n=1 Tax=Nonomuraea jiangxiensis TaxID=633440 RepID=A0A1G9UKJ8_9ACTN|nr:hypothetical protein [Nonomuraea jiangxiensis]SDM60416.1 hypothetical protein SAMN05421869_1493 [Nonomuraea jiangxiensis]